jgi:hypothetical protein
VKSYHDGQYALKQKIQGMSMHEARETIRDELTQMGFPHLSGGFVDAYLDVLKHKKLPGPTLRKVASIIWHAPGLSKKRRSTLRRLRSGQELGTERTATSRGDAHSAVASSQIPTRVEWGWPAVASIAFPILVLGVAGGIGYVATQTEGAVSDALIAIGAILGLLGIGAWDLTMLWVFPRMIESILKTVKGHGSQAEPPQ